MRRSIRAVVVVGCWSALLLAGAGMALADEECTGRLDQVRAALELRLSGKSLDPAQQASLVAAAERELHIERALWEDELEHHRARLGAADRGAPAGIDRLDQLGPRIRGELSVLEKAVAGDEEAAAELLDRSGTCPDGRISSSGKPLSVEVPRLPAPVRRRPRLEGLSRPEGYADPPSAAMLRAADSSQRPALKADQTPGAEDPITARAAELDNDPVEIFSFVLDEIRPAGYLGAMRGPVSTLRAGEGNDADQAALLAALLQEAGVPTRLVWGVQDMPVEAMLGLYGVSGDQELELVLTMLGLPWEPVLESGRITAYRLERVWCEAWLPFANFRGVVLDASGASWIALDPYIKQVTTQTQERLLDDMLLDHESFVASYLSGDGCQGALDQPLACPSPRDLLRDRIDAFLAARGSSYLTAVSMPEIAERSLDHLPGSMVGKVIEVHGFGLELEPRLQHMARLIARDQGEVLLDVELPVPELVAGEATIWFVPATEDDEAIVESYGGMLWEVPPYLVNVAVQLRVAGRELAVGAGSIGMGRPFELELRFQAPDGRSYRFVNEMTAGAPAGLSIAPGAQGYTSSDDEPLNLPELLATLGEQWLTNVARFESELATLEQRALLHPFPTVVTIQAVATAEMSLGLVEELSWKGLSIDADLYGSRLAEHELEAQRWTSLVTLEASAQERQLFEAHDATSVSADKVLMLAAQQGLTVHRIDQGNLAAILPGLPFDTEVLAEIEGWVRAGGVAEVPEAELVHIDWTGVGYRLIDPETAESRYQLAGRLSGGMTAIPWHLIWDSAREAVQYPTFVSPNYDDLQAVIIKKISGDYQLGTVGKSLLSMNDGEQLKVRVLDSRGVPVFGARVLFEITSGDGALNDGGSGSTVVPVSTSFAGIAAVDLTLGTSTEVEPYNVLEAGEPFTTRCTSVRVKARLQTSGQEMPGFFLELGRPDEVVELSSMYRHTTLVGLPHLSVGPLLAVPLDQYSNPVSNVEVRYALEDLPPPGQGPYLLSRQERESCGGGRLTPNDCPGGGGTILGMIKRDINGSAGTWVHLMLGDSTTEVTATAQTPSGLVSLSFTGEADISQIPTGNMVGWPAVLLSRRSQPVNRDGDIMEAYLPGQQTLPLKVSFLVTREDYEVIQCGDGRWCTSPLGTYRTERFREGHKAGCQPDSCAGGPGSVWEGANVGYYDLPGVSDPTVSSQNADGSYSLSPSMPSVPGRYVVNVRPTLHLRVPKIPDNPIAINEIVPCQDAGGICGAAQEIHELQDPLWQTSFVLFAVRATVSTPPLPIWLGHRNRIEGQPAFSFTVEPPDYPALDNLIYFTEDGIVRSFSYGEGSEWTTTELEGLPFENPSGHHEVGVVLNSSVSWQLGFGHRVGFRIESQRVHTPVLMVDLDIDSDNDNTFWTVERDDAEDALESPVDPASPQLHGKVLFANHNDDDNDGVPDYADLDVFNEKNIVVLELELRPEDGLYHDLGVVLEYRGPAPSQFPRDLTWAPDPIGSRGGQTVYDYTSAKVSSLRVWKIDDPRSLRTPGDLLVPGQVYSPTELGLGPDNPIITLQVEAVNGAKINEPPLSSVIRARILVNGESTQDEVTVLAFDGNLGVNCGNDHYLQSPVFLRPGTPDWQDYRIDHHDEVVEDQLEGYRFWRLSSSDSLATQTGTWLTDSTMVDAAPLRIEVPPYLVAQGYQFALRPGNDEFLATESLLLLRSVADVEPGCDFGTIPHLSSDYCAPTQKQIGEESISRTALFPGFYSRVDLKSYDGEQVGNWLFMIKAASADPSRETFQLNLVAAPPGSGDHPDPSEWAPVDSVRITAHDEKELVSVWSVRPSNRGSDANVPFTYPLEVVDGTSRTFAMERFPDATHVQGTGVRDPEVDQHLVLVHGYNVSPEDAPVYFSELAKRYHWIGYRGNILGFSWHGDPSMEHDISSAVPAPGAVAFGHANKFALQTSPAFRAFIRDTLRGQWNVNREDIAVMAHSLGNLVVYDALRIHSALDPGDHLFHTFVSYEPAIWGEAAWAQEDVTYCENPVTPHSCTCEQIGSTPDDCTYSVRELQCSSWAFWLNQEGQEAWRAVDKIVHSYNANDAILWGVMALSDLTLRQLSLSSQQFDRPTCPSGRHRIPYHDGTLSPEMPSLSYSSLFSYPGCPVMMKLNSRMPPNNTLVETYVCNAILHQTGLPHDHYIDVCNQLARDVGNWSFFSGLVSMIDLVVTPLGNAPLQFGVNQGAGATPSVVNIDGTQYGWISSVAMSPIKYVSTALLGHGDGHSLSMAEVWPWWYRVGTEIPFGTEASLHHP